MLSASTRSASESFATLSGLLSWDPARGDHFEFDLEARGGGAAAVERAGDLLLDGSVDHGSVEYRHPFAEGVRCSES
jgi:hypothetical protein